MISISNHSSVPSSPQGRLTLTSGTAVMTSSVSAGSTLYYTPACGQFVPIWNGAVFVMTDTGGELSQAASDTTKSPAAVGNNSNYDIFVWSDSGTIRATRGPAWSSDTTRGTGAGTTELQLQNGIYVNKNAITNGPVALYGTYVGTVRSNGSATLDMYFGGSAAGGSPALLNVWNLYNQVRTVAKVADSTNSWTYTSNTTRAANASNGNRVSFVSGLAMHAVDAQGATSANTAAVAGHQIQSSISLDATTGIDAVATYSNGAAAAVQQPFFERNVYVPQIGFHYIQLCERSDNTNTATFNGFGIFTILEVSTWQ